MILSTNQGWHLNSLHEMQSTNGSREHEIGSMNEMENLSHKKRDEQILYNIPFFSGLSEAELREPSGTLMASGSGKYMPIDERAVGPMLSDFPSDPRAAFARINGPKPPDATV